MRKQKIKHLITYQVKIRIIRTHGKEKTREYDCTSTTILLFWGKKQKVEDVDDSPLSVTGLEN